MRAFSSLDNDLMFIIDHDSPVQDPIEEEIMGLANLQEGWDYGEGIPPSAETIDRAIEIYRISKAYGLGTEIFPIGHGEILISFSKDNVFTDILLNENGSIRLTKEIGIGDEFERLEIIENVTPDIINGKLKEMAGVAECTLSELCASDPIVGKSSDSSLKVFEIFAAQYQSLIENAFSAVTKPQYALT